MEIKVSNGRITSDVFVLCEASKLSLDDEFMKHKPCSGYEGKLKMLLEEAIKSGLKDFYLPVYDPSFDKDGNICYVADAKPAVGKSYNWWEEKAKQFCPERGSRLGTEKEYVAFLGILIKKLSESGWTIAEAWNAVCNDSKELGHYCNSSNAKHKLESTGSRKICVFYDLANTFKILSENEEFGGFWRAGGYFDFFGNFFPLAFLEYYNAYFNYRNHDFNFCVGWLVLEK